LQKFVKNSPCKISRWRARDRDRNHSRPRLIQDLRPSRARLQKTDLETSLETETKSRDSITDMYWWYQSAYFEEKSHHQKNNQELKNIDIWFVLTNYVSIVPKAILCSWTTTTISVFQFQ